MIKVEFSEQELKTIEYERFHHPIPRVQRRMEVLWLKSQGLPHKQISKISGACDNAVTKYLRLYRQGGLDEVRKVNFYRPESDLETYSDSIEQHFRNNPVANIAQAAAEIERLTGIRRSKTQVGVFLKKLGMKYRKVGSIPASADSEAQEEFKKKTLNQE
ncbi:transposase (fragment) [Desulfosarcina cetonica]